MDNQMADDFLGGILGEVTSLREREGKSANAIRLADELGPTLSISADSYLVSLGYLERFVMKIRESVTGDPTRADSVEILDWAEG